MVFTSGLRRDDYRKKKYSVVRVSQGEQLDFFTLPEYHFVYTDGVYEYVHPTAFSTYVGARKGADDYCNFLNS